MSNKDTLPPPALNNRDNRPSSKMINIAFANLNKNLNAFTELILARPRDSIILTCETPTSDNIPPNAPGYYLIYEESPINSPAPRVCAYIKNSAIDLLDKFTCSRDLVTLNLIDGWTIKATYTEPSSPIDPRILTPIDKRTIILGDFNAKNELWFDTTKLDNGHSLARGKTLHAWSRRTHTCERGPRLPTRHRAGEKPSKLDLIWTRRDSAPFIISDYSALSHSDHMILHAKFCLMKPPRVSFSPRPDYKRMTKEKVLDFFRKSPPPTNSDELDKILNESLQMIPRLLRNPQKLLPPDLRQQRSALRNLMHKRWGSNQYVIARKEYRENLREFINDTIEESLDSAQNPEFFKFTRRTPVAKPIPTLSLNGQIYAGHARIAKCLADHHGCSTPIKLHPIRSPDIPPVLTHEVTEAITKAPPRSASGPDAISAELFRLLHTAHPLCIGQIYTDILRSGKHPANWKTATVVPIPKANKPTYTHPKSWRSIHLLSIVSKTLERIVLQRLQKDDSTSSSHRPMGPTQFGSRNNLGTSDAMQTYLRWKENATHLGHYTTIISADVEGGFDRVDPSRLNSTDLNHLYTPWIRHWAGNRTMRFRHNARLDPTQYTANNGIPQGSPLSPFLFGAYIKELMNPRIIATTDASRIIISYVDDVLICVSSSTRPALQKLAEETWELLSLSAQSHQMSFAKNKTKTLHDRKETWGIGSTVPNLRFLGYWIETPDDSNRLAPPPYQRHLDHWTTKANFSFNTLRALTLRSNKGLRTPAILKILDACTRSVLLYGLEFWGSDPILVKKADAFIYAALRTLFDLPIATPHRALSSEFSIIPTAIRYQLITRRIAARRLLNDPLEWLNEYLPNGTFRNLIRSSLDRVFENEIVKWDNNPGSKRFLEDFLCQDAESSFKEGDLLVCTDGSNNGGVSSYSFCIFEDEGCSALVMEYNAILTPRKTILDAEATALICGLDAALALPSFTGAIYLLSDCKAALRMLSNPKAEGPLEYLTPALEKLAQTRRSIHANWIKGHAGHPGNERADILAKTAHVLNDPFPGISHSYLALHLTTATSTEWLAWFSQVQHEYNRPPRRNTKQHRGLTRLESSILFRLRANKGWSHCDNIGNKPPIPCPCDNLTPRDGTHLMSCPTTSRLRPPDILSWVHQDRRRNSIIRWAAYHRYFNITVRTSPVQWIRLSRPGNIVPTQTPTCSICSRTFTNKSHLNRHEKHIHPDQVSSLFTIGPSRSCTNCLKNFQTKTELDLHTATVHGCPDCQKKFTDIANMFRHTIKKYGGLLCAGCNHHYSSRISLRMHQRSNCGGSRS